MVRRVHGVGLAGLCPIRRWLGRIWVSAITVATMLVGSAASTWSAGVDTITLFTNSGGEHWQAPRVNYPSTNSKPIYRAVITMSRNMRLDECSFQGFEDAVDSFLDDHIITEAEETQLAEYASSLNLSESERDRSGGQTRAVMGAVLRQVVEGEIPQRQKVEGNLPFNFQKSEECVSVFDGVTLYEERTRTRFEGGSTGVSMRVAKGVYLRQSAFRGHPVSTTELTYIDDGLLALTTKHLYFAGGRKSYRTPYAKIVSFQSYNDGLGVQRDAMTAKPQVYKLTHGWFAYNLARNLAEA